MWFCFSWYLVLGTINECAVHANNESWQYIVHGDAMFAAWLDVPSYLGWCSLLGDSCKLAPLAPFFHRGSWWLAWTEPLTQNVRGKRKVHSPTRLANFLGRNKSPPWSQSVAHFLTNDSHEQTTLLLAQQAARGQHAARLLERVHLLLQTWTFATTSLISYAKDLAKAQTQKYQRAKSRSSLYHMSNKIQKEGGKVCTRARWVCFSYQHDASCMSVTHFTYPIVSTV